MNLTQLQAMTRQYGSQVLQDLTQILLNVTPQSTIEAHSRLHRAIDDHVFADDANPNAVYIEANDTGQPYMVSIETIYDDPIMRELLHASSTIALQTALLLRAYSDRTQSDAITVYTTTNGTLQRL